MGPRAAGLSFGIRTRQQRTQEAGLQSPPPKRENRKAVLCPPIDVRAGQEVSSAFSVLLRVASWVRHRTLCSWSTGSTDAGMALENFAQKPTQRPGLSAGVLGARS